MTDLGADGALLTHFEGRRQRAGPQQRGGIARLLHREAAGDLARAAQYGFLDHRRAQDFAIKDNGEGLADVALCELAEDPRPVAVETEGHDRFLGVLVKPGGGIDQMIAGQRRAPLERVADVAIAGLPASWWCLCHPRFRREAVRGGSSFARCGPEVS